MSLSSNWLTLVENKIFSKYMQRFKKNWIFFFENFKISQNNIIGVKTTKVLKYDDPTRTLCYNNTRKNNSLIVTF